MKHPKAYYQNMKLAGGFTWCGWCPEEAKGKGRHFFISGNYREGFKEILATDEDIENGNLDFFIEHGYSNTGVK